MSGPADVVARQLVRSGSTFVHGLDPLDPAEFFGTLPTGFSPGWTAGHLACVADLWSSLFDGYQLFDPEFHAVFNDTAVTEPCPGRSKAAGVNQDTYPKAILLHRFREGMVKALDALDTFDPELWDAPGPPGTPLPLRAGGDVWEHFGVHAYWHLGELAGSMPRFRDTYTMNVLAHDFYRPGRR